ncbi:T9SS type A sorting domain-containing protein [Hymenobacter armeniacus]|uniref:T9SS type A sorting domain-containing protein n=1 Tax=Hymenobacter armeniacus TaxID=2771358 RepID=A0ABR8JN77_9BACT|nr:T9SS type A sorting domain-containing protein [Hymenobacter armeniacus]MBD2720500.1 T9SS type A sorting domain-containing protein [Hymenobacter armeniacus]
MKTLRLLAAGFLLGLRFCQPAAGQTLDPGFTSPLSLYTTGKVYYMGPPQADGKRVLGGYFTRANGAAANSFARFDDLGNVDLPFSQNVGSVGGVAQVLGLPTGQYLLVGNGNTVTAGGLTRPELLRLNANGTADASFGGGAGPSGSQGYGFGQAFAVQPDGKILVAGSFETYHGVPAAGVVRLNANGSVDATFNVGTGFGAGAFPETIAVQPDGKILIGGDFTSFNGQFTQSLVRLNANGSVDASFVSPLLANSFVEGLVLQPDGKVLANGYLALSGAGATAYAGLVRLQPTGGLDANFAVSLFQDGDVSNSSSDPAVLLQADGKIIVSGYFTGAVGNHVARLNPDGTADLTFQVGTGPSQAPATLGLQPNGSLLVGGEFGTFNNLEQPVVRLTPAGALETAFLPRLQNPGFASALALQPDGKLLLGGDFTELNGQPVHRLVRLLPNGTLDAAFGAATGALSDAVTSLRLQPDGKVLAGTALSVLRFDASGAPDATFTPFVSGPGYYVSTVNGLAVQADGRILVAGYLSGTANGLSFNGVVRLTSTGAVDPSFARPVVNGTLGNAADANAVLVQSDGRIVVAGRFRTGTQGSVYRVVRYESTGALDAGFFNTTAYTLASTTIAPGQVFDLAQQADGRLLVGGYFNQVGGLSRYGVARLLATGALDPSFFSNTVLAGTVRTLAIQPNGRVLLGGNFNATVPGVGTLVNLARVLDNGQLDTSFGPTANPNNVVRAVEVQPNGAIVLAGQFISVAGLPRVGVARITAANVLAVQAPTAVAERTAAWPVPAHGQLHIAPDLSARPIALDLTDALGRTVRHQAAGSAPKQTMDLAGLPAGVYLLRVQYASGTVARRIAVE